MPVKKTTNDFVLLRLICLLSWLVAGFYFFYRYKADSAFFGVDISVHVLDYIFIILPALMITAGVYALSRGGQEAFADEIEEGEWEALDKINEKILENIPVGVLVLDRRGVVISATAFFEELSGDPIASIIGRNFLESSFVKNANLTEQYRNVLEKGIPFHYDRCITHANDPAHPVKYLDVSVVPNRGESGEIKGAFSFGHDNTITIKTEGRMEAKTKQLYLMNQIGQAVNSVLDLKEVLWLILRNAVKLTEATAAAVLFIKDDKLVPQEGYNMIEDLKKMRIDKNEGICGHVIKTRRPYYANDTSHDQYYLPTPGRVVINSELVVPIIIKKEVIGVLEIGSSEKDKFNPNDVEIITALANNASVAIANSQLYERMISLKRLSDNIVDSSSVSMIVTDAMGKIIRFNKAATAIMSSKARLEVGAQMYVDYARSMPDGLSLIERVAQTKKTISFDRLPYVNRDGVRRFLNIKIDPLLNPKGEVENILITTIDLTEQVKLEEEINNLNKNLEKKVKQRTKQLDIANQKLSRAMDLKTKFIADASHELRTPLTVIRGNLDITARSADNSYEDYKDTLHIIDGETNRMAGILADLTILAQADSSQQVKWEDINLEMLLNGVAQSMRVLGKDRGIAVELGKIEKVDLRGDNSKLEKLFINLVSNAIKYGKRGGWVKLSMAKQKNGVRIIVEDNGIGIGKDDLPLVFERFYRVDKVRSRQTGGSGLGLAICKSIVDMHGGEISVKSAMGKGSTFIVDLPGNKDKSSVSYK